jgi:hypothetical protein
MKTSLAQVFVMDSNIDSVVDLFEPNTDLLVICMEVDDRVVNLIPIKVHNGVETEFHQVTNDSYLIKLATVGKVSSDQYIIEMNRALPPEVVDIDQYSRCWGITRNVSSVVDLINSTYNKLLDMKGSGKLSYLNQNKVGDRIGNI